MHKIIELKCCSNSSSSKKLLSSFWLHLQYPAAATPCINCRWANRNNLHIAGINKPSE